MQLFLKYEPAFQFLISILTIFSPHYILFFWNFSCTIFNCPVHIYMNFETLGQKNKLFTSFQLLSATLGKFKTVRSFDISQDETSWVTRDKSQNDLICIRFLLCQKRLTVLIIITSGPYSWGLFSRFLWGLRIELLTVGFYTIKKPQRHVFSLWVEKCEMKLLKYKIWNRKVLRVCVELGEIVKCWKFCFFLLPIILKWPLWKPKMFTIYLEKKFIDLEAK